MAFGPTRQISTNHTSAYVHLLLCLPGTKVRRLYLENYLVSEVPKSFQSKVVHFGLYLLFSQPQKLSFHIRVRWRIYIFEYEVDRLKGTAMS